MKHSESIARLLILAGLLPVILVPLLLWQRTPLIHARLPEAGGWSVDSLRASVGEPLRLRLTSDDVVHGFAVGRHEMPSADILPGKVTEVSITFDAPGTYTFYCTRWCGLNHWRMRGTIEVTAPAQTGVAEPEPAGPLYAALGIDLDAPREAAVVPARKPLAAIPMGQRQLALARYSSVDYYRRNSPAEVWLQLSQDAALKALDDRELWELTAAIWNANAAPAALAEGRDLFARNCAACHGEGGAGDGVFADDLAAAASDPDLETGMIARPADLTDPQRMLAASPALLHGKILRGGMGTGMPSWGPIFSDQQVWNLVAYIYSFQFTYR